MRPEGMPKSVYTCKALAARVMVLQGYTPIALGPYLTSDDGLGGCPHCLCNLCVVTCHPTSWLVANLLINFENCRDKIHTLMQVLENVH